MSWEARAACAQEQFDPEIFFGNTRDDERRAKAVCGTCSVRIDCLAAALVGRLDFGIWGGLNERERRRLTRRHPQVRDWRDYLAANGLSRLSVRA
jgi:WhiB family redox-sensing transcriptional regulator